MPNPTQENLLKQPELTLTGLRKGFVGRDYRCSELYNKACKGWGGYFQSPVNKAAQTLKPAFEFNEWGAFKDQGDDLKNARNALFDWLGRPDDDIEAWLKTGTPLSPEKLHVIKQKLSDETLTNHDLYDQPICRLVHREQLRRDLDYQVVYQVTPGQSRLLDVEEDPEKEPSPERLRPNQRAYWGVSEAFQSLVAMFDSDLGTNRPPKANHDQMTKELIRIVAQKGPEADSPLAPDELNRYSPLRFWSPPPAFAGSVFHMLFWRSVITGKDLFGRPVIKPPKEPQGQSEDGNQSSLSENSGSIVERANQYYIIINWFNAAKFRLAAYDRLFETLMAISGIIGTNEAIKADRRLCEMKKDVLLPNQASTSLLYPNYVPHTTVTFREFPPLILKLPFKTVDKQIWELARGHHSQQEKDQPTRVSHLLKFLRDKALELIVWSKYQMEIRSVGLIPAQYLYRIDLTGPAKERLSGMAFLFKKYQDLRDGKGDPPQHPADPEDLLRKINSTMLQAFGGHKSIEDWVVLKKVCGGTYRTVFDEKAWKEIKPLESPRAKSSSSRR